MKRAFLAMILLLAASPASYASDEFFDEYAEREPLKRTYYLYALGEDFRWKEFDAGTQLLVESGDLYGGGAEARFESESTFYRVRADYFQGEVDYDGGTWAGVPATTKVNYYGVRLEGDAGLKYSSGRATLEPLAGLGVRWWRRDLENSAMGLGYLEKWHTVYFKVGARAEVDLGPVRPFVEAAGRIGIFNNNVADFGFTEVSLNPGGELTPYAEAGLSIGPIRAGVYYEEWNFSRSDVAPAEGFGFGPGWGLVQPQSKGRVFGARAGISF